MCNKDGEVNQCPTEGNGLKAEDEVFSYFERAAAHSRKGSQLSSLRIRKPCYRVSQRHPIQLCWEKAGFGDQRVPTYSHCPFFSNKFWDRPGWCQGPGVDMKAPWLLAGDPSTWTLLPPRACCDRKERGDSKLAALQVWRGCPKQALNCCTTNSPCSVSEINTKLRPPETMEDQVYHFLNQFAGGQDPEAPYSDIFTFQ